LVDGIGIFVDTRRNNFQGNRWMKPYPYLKKGTLVDKVFDALKEGIFSGRMKKGEKLPPQDVLAGEFGVSRTVIREAYKKLSSMGLIESRQGSGTFVSVPDAGALMDPLMTTLMLDETSIRELIEARYYLEKVIVGIAASRVVPEDIAELKACLATMKDSGNTGDYETFSQADNIFHKQLAAIAKNSILNRILETIWDLNYRFLIKFSRTEGAVGRAIDHHERILNAMAEKDPDRAEAEMSEHLRDIVQAVNKHFKLDFDLMPSDRPV